AELGTRNPEPSVHRVLDRLELALERAQEGERAGPIQDTVVETQATVHHAADRDRIVGGDDGPLDDGFHGDDTGLANRHDWLTHDRAQRARVVHRERGALQVVHRQLARARLLDDAAQRARHAGHAQLVGIAQHGHDQSVFDRYGDAQVVLAVYHQMVAGPARVQLGHRSQA